MQETFGGSPGFHLLNSIIYTSISVDLSLSLSLQFYLFLRIFEGHMFLSFRKRSALKPARSHCSLSATLLQYLLFHLLFNSFLFSLILPTLCLILSTLLAYLQTNSPPLWHHTLAHLFQLILISDDLSLSIGFRKGFWIPCGLSVSGEFLLNANMSFSKCVVKTCKTTGCIRISHRSQCVLARRFTRRKAIDTENNNNGK